MNPNKKSNTFAESLLRQDLSFSDTEMKEYRMHLEQKLVAARRSEWRMRLVVIAAWLAALLLPLGFVVVDRIQRGMSPMPPIRLAIPPEVHAVPGTLGNFVNLMYLATISLAWLLVFVYLIKSRPSLRRAKEEYEAGLFADLQRQLSDLKRQPPADG